MSFRGRLSLFFVLIVIVPMVSLTVVLFRLLSDNEQGKSDARTASRQQAAQGLAESAMRRADAVAVKIGGDVPLATALRENDRAAASQRAKKLLGANLAKRIVITRGSKTVVDVGAGNAILPTQRRLLDERGKSFGTLLVSTTGPRAYVDDVKRITGLHVVLREGERTLAATMKGVKTSQLDPKRGKTTMNGESYRTATFTEPGFERSVNVTILNAGEASAAEVRSSRIVAATILLGFFVLAFTFAVLVSRSLQRQIEGFLDAARRLGRGDFSAMVPTVGNDEFSALGHEFNLMSRQLEDRLEQLRAEQARVALSMRRIGEAFGSNLDRHALLELVVRTAVDAAGAMGGRGSLRTGSDRQLHQVAYAGSLDDLTAAVNLAEAGVLETGNPEETTVETGYALAYPLRAEAASDEGPARLTGIISIARHDHPFTDGERDLFHYLAGQAALSIENVGLHETVERQAVTDDLTGLANRRRFQEVLQTEIERSRRFGQPLSLVMLDIDHFKHVNDTYGHQAGDFVLREVARILLESSREIDEPARYGGEELAVILPETDPDGAFLLAERVRTQIAALELPIGDPADGPVRITASLGTATHPLNAEGPDALIAAADEALYEAKDSGRNRTVRAESTSTT